MLSLNAATPNDEHGARILARVRAHLDERDELVVHALAVATVRTGRSHRRRRPNATAPAAVARNHLEYMCEVRVAFAPLLRRLARQRQQAAAAAAEVVSLRSKAVPVEAAAVPVRFGTARFDIELDTRTPANTTVFRFLAVDTRLGDDAEEEGGESAAVSFVYSIEGEDKIGEQLFELDSSTGHLKLTRFVLFFY